MKIAVIPARGGSKRLPRKNIKEFFGKPIITMAIATAKESRLFDHVIVSTDDEEIAEIGRKAGAETPFVRPAKLSDDLTPTVPVIAHAVKSCIENGLAVKYACCIYPCVPFLKVDDLSEEEIEFEFNKILDGFSPIIKSVEDKFMEHRDELLIMKNV